jgi:hypothetical protein
MAATLRLTRKWGGLTERTIEWQILLDGETVGTIAKAQTVELSIGNGYHTLRVKSPRHHSPQRSFYAEEDEVVSFSCRAAMIWPQYVAALIAPDLWISLKQI